MTSDTSAIKVLNASKTKEKFLVEEYKPTYEYYQYINIQKESTELQKNI